MRKGVSSFGVIEQKISQTRYFISIYEKTSALVLADSVSNEAFFIVSDGCVLVVCSHGRWGRDLYVAS